LLSKAAARQTWTGSGGGGRVTVEGFNVFLDPREILVAESELRFRSLEELTRTLNGTGFSVEHVYGDWKKGSLLSTSRMVIFVARRN
jgi:hypothetical protein